MLENQRYKENQRFSSIPDNLKEIFVGFSASTTLARKFSLVSSFKENFILSYFFITNVKTVSCSIRVVKAKDIFFNLLCNFNIML